MPDLDLEPGDYTDRKPKRPMSIIGRWALLLFVVFCPVSPSQAMSGAELIQLPRSDGEMYVWGLVHGLVTYATQETAETAYQRQDCLVNAGVTSSTFFEALVAEVRRDPSNLSAHDSLLVVKLVAKICGI